MSTDLDRELERTTALRGFRFGLHDFVGHLGAPKLSNATTTTPKPAT